MKLTLAQAPLPISSPNVNRLPGSGNESNGKFFVRIFFYSRTKSLAKNCRDTTIHVRWQNTIKLDERRRSSHFIGFTIFKIVHEEIVVMKSIIRPNRYEFSHE